VSGNNQTHFVDRWRSVDFDLCGTAAVGTLNHTVPPSATKRGLPNHSERARQ
jgi:hypothetical protein